jgi:hypothetical protein
VNVDGKKPGGCRDLAHALQIVDEISAVIGMRPSVVVRSGSGLHPYWPIEDGQIDDEATRERVETLLRRWRNLCVSVAAAHGASIDSNVFDLPRVLRIPNTRNHKRVPAVLVEARADTGAPMSLDELAERLDEAGFVDDRRCVGGVVDGVDVDAAVRGWAYAERACGYMLTVIDAWATDPISLRHGWLLDKAIKLASAHRKGCLTQDLHRRGIETIASRLSAARATDGSDRQNRGEFARTMRDAIVRVAAFSDEKILDELNHLHDDELTRGTAPAISVCEVSEVSESLVVCLGIS